MIRKCLYCLHVKNLRIHLLTQFQGQESSWGWGCPLVKKWTGLTYFLQKMYFFPTFSLKSYPTQLDLENPNWLQKKIEKFWTMAHTFWMTNNVREKNAGKYNLFVSCTVTMIPITPTWCDICLVKWPSCNPLGFLEGTHSTYDVLSLKNAPKFF